jgi:hypothetical protein
MDRWLWDWNKKLKILLFGENFVFAHAECAPKKIILCVVSLDKNYNCYWLLLNSYVCVENNFFKFLILGFFNTLKIFENLRLIRAC